MRTIVYVDAFNLYYGALKGTPYRWLDLSRMCDLLLDPKHQVARIRYFTAYVKALPHDPDQPRRQQTYLRALKMLPNVSIHLGHFLSHVVQMPRARPRFGRHPLVEVIKSEEKGSDVNLATYLLCDAYEDECDAAVVVSNDSDLLEPVRILRDRLGIVVGILNPQPHPSAVLRKNATFFKQIRKGVLATSQFPEILTDSHGSFQKPESW